MTKSFIVSVMGFVIVTAQSVNQDQFLMADFLLVCLISWITFRYSEEWSERQVNRSYAAALYGSIFYIYFEKSNYNSIEIVLGFAFSFYITWFVLLFYFSSRAKIKDVIFVFGAFISLLFANLVKYEKIELYIVAMTIVLVSSIIAIFRSPE